MNAQELEWNDLRIVLSVCRQGSLSGAARELGVNHSTVFRRIAAIEEKIAVRLFERQATGYAMTKAGEVMLASAERIEEEFFSLSRKLIGGDLRLNGNLRVTAPDALTMEILMPHIVHFCQSYPGIILDLIIENDLLDLGHREADIAIRSTKSPPDSAIGHKLCRLGATIYGSKTYLNKHSKTTLDQYNWLMPSNGLDWFSANQWLKQNHPKASVAFRSNNLPGLFEAVKNHLGIAPLPFFLAEPLDTLQPVIDPSEPFFSEPFTSELWLLIHPDLRNTARVRAFANYLREAIEQEQERIERPFGNKIS